MEGEKKEVIRDMRHIRLPNSSRPVYQARTDGSFKEGEGASWAALISEDGEALAHGSLAYPRGTSANETEARAILLALLLAPKKVVLHLGTDYQGLVEAWAKRASLRDANGFAPVVEAIGAVARALDLEVHLYKVPRKEVKLAHDGAQAARKERPLVEGSAKEAYALLRKLPARYRMAALTLLENYKGEPEGLLGWPKKGKSPTYLLLQEAIAPLGKEEVGRILEGVHALPQGVREALKGKDWPQARDEVMAERPPTERQLELLARLGYQGSLPQDRLAVSRLIARLLED
ncbi:MAG: reverse transcriptase-like protein [Thermus sp.]|nr:reverse transcriptase-like protein [Thermus sp.]